MKREQPGIFLKGVRPFLQLKNEQKINPFWTVSSFFECYHLNDVQDSLQRLRGSIKADISSAKDRENLLFFCDQVELLAEAAFLLKDKGDEAEGVEIVRRLLRECR